MAGQRLWLAGTARDEYEVTSRIGRRQNRLAVGGESIGERIFEPERDGRRPTHLADVDTKTIREQELTAIVRDVGHTGVVEPGQVAFGRLAGGHTHHRPAFFVAREQDAPV